MDLITASQVVLAVLVGLAVIAVAAIVLRLRRKDEVEAREAHKDHLALIVKTRLEAAIAANLNAGNLVAAGAGKLRVVCLELGPRAWLVKVQAFRHPAWEIFPHRRMVLPPRETGLITIAIDLDGTKPITVTQPQRKAIQTEHGAWEVSEHFVGEFEAKQLPRLETLCRNFSPDDFRVLEMMTKNPHIVSSRPNA